MNWRSFFTGAGVIEVIHNIRREIVECRKAFPKLLEKKEVESSKEVGA